MFWYESVYLSESVLGNEKQIIDKINNGSFFVKAYLVCLSSNNKNLFDIINARELCQKGYPKHKLHIIGICKTKYEAIELVAGFVQEMVMKDLPIETTSLFHGKWRESYDFS